MEGRPAAAPVGKDTLRAYVESWPATLGPSGRKLRIAGLAHGHRLAGASWQDGDPAAVALVRASAADEKALAKRLACCCGDLSGLRDRAALLLHHRGGLTRIQIAALDHADLHRSGDALEITLRDTTGASSVLPIARRRGGALCLVGALESWLQAERIRHGAVITRLGAHGWPDGRLDRRGIRRLLQAIEERVAAVSLPPGRAPVAGAWRSPAHRKAVRDRTAGLRKREE